MFKRRFPISTCMKNTLARYGRLLAPLVVLALGTSSCSSFQKRWSSDRAPSSAPVTVFKKIFQESADEADHWLSWLYFSKGVVANGDAPAAAKEAQLLFSGMTRSELAAHPAVYEILMKDFEKVTQEEAAFLHQFVQSQRAQVMRGGGQFVATATHYSRYREIMRREILQACGDAEPCARAGIEFLDRLNLLAAKDRVDARTIAGIIRQIPPARMSADQGPGVFDTLQLLIVHHGKDLDTDAAIKLFRTAGPESLATLRAAYREALASGISDPRTLLYGKSAPILDPLGIDREFAKTRDTYDAWIGRLMKFSGSGIRATDQYSQALLARMDYYIRIGDKMSARALVERKFKAVETAHLLADGYKKLVAEGEQRLAREGGAAASSNLRKEIAQWRSFQIGQEKIVGAYFEEYRVVRMHLENLAGERAGRCSPECREMAREMDLELGLRESDHLTFPDGFPASAKRPTLEEVEKGFHASKAAVAESLKRAVRVEVGSAAVNFASNLLILKDVQKLAAKIPAMSEKLKWTREVLFMLYDVRARSVHFPEISRIMRSQGGIKAQLDMLEQMSLPPNEDLLVTFARRLDDDTRKFWHELKGQARLAVDPKVAADASAGGWARYETLSGRLVKGETVSFFDRMEAAEEVAVKLGGISPHFQQSPAGKIATLVMLSAGYGTYTVLDELDDKRFEEFSKEVEKIEQEIQTRAATDPEVQKLKFQLEGLRARADTEAGRQTK